MWKKVRGNLTGLEDSVEAVEDAQVGKTRLKVYSTLTPAEVQRLEKAEAVYEGKLASQTEGKKLLKAWESVEKGLIERWNRPEGVILMGAGRQGRVASLLGALGGRD